jgi:hypothetical protein
MDRSSFLKKLAAGVALPSMLTGCDTSGNDQDGILDPGDEDGALKVTSTEANPNDWEIIMYRFSYNKYYLNKIGRVGDKSIYHGVEHCHNLEPQHIVGYYDEIQQNLLVVSVAGSNSVFSFLGKLCAFYPRDERRFFYGPWHLYYRGTPMDMDLCLYIEKGEFPGMQNMLAKPALNDGPPMNIPDNSDFPPFLKDIE